MTTNWLYFFANGHADGGSDIKHLVGGKGASLADMTKAGLQVPPGFTLSAECCHSYFQNGERWPTGLDEQLRAALKRLETVVGRPFGQGESPLLVAVRSGAAQSMPGMMDTVLNVGLHLNVVRAMAARLPQPRAVWDAFRHFITMYGHTVAGIEETEFTGVIADFRREIGKASEDDFDVGQMEQLCLRLLAEYHEHAGHNLPADPWQQLCEAVSAVFRSWNNERAVTYRRHHRIEGLAGTAVTVQQMCPAEVSGVLFTANPVNPDLEQILIEASFGLGEAIVLGKVTPDRFVLDKKSLQILERNISVKGTITGSLGGVARPRDAASLDDSQIAELARLGLRVEAFFQTPCDVEWALAEGRFFLLQARPIRRAQVTNDEAEREEVRKEEIAALRARAEPGGTVWSRFNLAEILPTPTPMTWSVVQRFMSGRGGYGLMYRDLGFDPDPALDEEGVFDLVCGRPYCNLSREPRMHFRNLPFEHNFAALKAEPRRALYPQPALNPAKLGWRFWLFLPVTVPRLIVRMTRAELRRRELGQTFAPRFRNELLPAFVAETEQGAAEDLAKLDDVALLARLEHWTQRVLYDFARESLKPTALTAFAMGSLERQLVKSLGPERTQAALRELVMGVGPEADANLPAALRDLAAGKLHRADFLKRFGHRGSHEMELSQPRWAEDPVALDLLLQQPAPPLPEQADAWERIAAEAKLTTAQKAELWREVESLRLYLGLRETGKHYLLKGYVLIRRVLVELDRRYRLDGGLFFLTIEDLPNLLKGQDLSAKIEKARRRRELALSLEVPQVLFSDDLEAIGRPISVAGSDVLQGVPLSAGIAEAPALVLLEPTARVPDEPFILVCPSTDPAWVPLFARAKALVMETGGVLSHGAIVARDYGLPAVAGLPDVHRRLRTGQRLRVDGAKGTVTVVNA